MSLVRSIKVAIRHLMDVWQNAKVASNINEQYSCSIGLPRLVEGSRHISIGRGSSIREGAWLGAFPEIAPLPIQRPHRIVIQDKVYIGFFATITAVDLIEIQSGTMISDHFYASDHTHGHDPREGSPSSQALICRGPIVIGRNCFIGMRVSILAGVTIGDNCVVGAHSVVTRSFPERSMIAGAPARLIKTFDLESGQWIAVNDDKVGPKVLSA